MAFCYRCRNPVQPGKFCSKCGLKHDAGVAGATMSTRIITCTRNPTDSAWGITYGNETMSCSDPTVVAKISAVVSGSPCARAGLRTGDIIISINSDASAVANKQKFTETLNRVASQAQLQPVSLQLEVLTATGASFPPQYPLHVGSMTTHESSSATNVTPNSASSITPPAQGTHRVVIDIGVHRSGETPPAGWVSIQKTKQGNHATLNKGAPLGSATRINVYVCVLMEDLQHVAADTRIVENIAVFEQGKDPVPHGHDPLMKTISGGSSGDLNAGYGGDKLFFAIKRTPLRSAINAVKDVQIVLPYKQNESLSTPYVKVDRDLNSGSKSFTAIGSLFSKKKSIFMYLWYLASPYHVQHIHITNTHGAAHNSTHPSGGDLSFGKQQTSLCWASKSSSNGTASGTMVPGLDGHQATVSNLRQRQNLVPAPNQLPEVEIVKELQRICLAMSKSNSSTRSRSSSFVENTPPTVAPLSKWEIDAKFSHDFVVEREILGNG